MCSSGADATLRSLIAGTAGRVRDPVHGYIPFTAIERTLFDHPVAQRLRAISQSAAAHLVFPEMRVSRFAHSPGAMHLASRFLGAILRNAGPAERDQIVAACRTLVDGHSGLGLGDAEQVILGEPALVAGPELQSVDRAAVLFVEQGLRLASLSHDLGHLPFSHDFEIALEACMRADPALRERLKPLFAADVRGEKIHERVGYALAASVQQRVFNADLVGTPSAKVAEVSLLVARDILDAPAAPELARMRCVPPCTTSIGWPTAWCRSERATARRLRPRSCRAASARPSRSSSLASVCTPGRSSITRSSRPRRGCASPSRTS